jgi:hypothetical protein
MNYVTIEPRYNLTVEKMPEQQPGRFKQPPIYIFVNEQGWCRANCISLTFLWVQPLCERP